MNVTGSTLKEVTHMDPEELLATRHMIGAWNRQKNSKAKEATKGGKMP